MRILTAVLSLLPIVTWFFMKNKKNKDTLSPINILTALYIIQIAIPSIYYSNPNNILSIPNQTIKNAVSSDDNYFLFILLSVASYYLVLLGIKICNKFKINNDNGSKQSTSDRDRRMFKITGILLWIIGLIATIITINEIGGIKVLLSNQYQRTNLLRNLDLLSALRPFLGYGCILIAFSKKQKINIWFLLFAIITGVIQGLGARRPMVMLVIQIVFIYHYMVSKINFRKILSLKNIILVYILFTLFTFLLFIRTSNASSSISQNITNYINSPNSSIISTISNESYIRHHILTIDYFKNHDYWYGSSYYGLVTSIIPSGIYPQKPPVDDGTYLYSISLGREDIIPPMSFKELNTSSYPLETFSSMYANFGIIGVIIGSLIKGLIIGHIYKMMIKRNKNPIYIYAYITIVFNLELATLNIFQVCSSIIIMSIIIKSIQTLSNTKRRNEYAL